MWLTTFFANNKLTMTVKMYILHHVLFSHGYRHTHITQGHMFTMVGVGTPKQYTVFKAVYSRGEVM